jgi:hypothetical protein
MMTTTNDGIVFFDVTLENAHPMSTPVYEPPLGLIGELIRSIERSAPDFCWIEFLFVEKSHTHNFTRLRSQIQRKKLELEAQRKFLTTDWFKQSDKRMKKIDEIVNKPHLLMCLQGMWVSPEGVDQTSSIRDLLFSHCSDEIDRLFICLYKDPRFLVDLVERNMVTDISFYFRRYTGTRIEAPSFVIPADQLVSYVHIPTGDHAKMIHSLNWGEYSATPSGKTRVGFTETDNGKSSSNNTGWEDAAFVARLEEIPEIPEEKKVEGSTQMEAASSVSQLASVTQRGFEIVYDGRSKTTDILLSSKQKADLWNYIKTFESIYGSLKFKHETDLRPSFLSELPQRWLYPKKIRSPE